MLGQWWNGAAVFATLRYACLRPSLLMPKFQTETLSRVDWAKLKEEHGVDFVVFDKDNTLTAPYAQDLHPSIDNSVYLCQHVFYKSHVAIFSNSAGTQDDTGYHWKNNIEQSIQIPVIVHEQKKPLGFRSILTHFERATGQKEIHPKQVLVVGDRLLTDVLLGNLHDAQTLHCTEPLTLKGDNPIASAIRTLETQTILPMLKAAGIPPPERILIDV